MLKKRLMPWLLDIDFKNNSRASKEVLEFYTNHPFEIVYKRQSIPQTPQNINSKYQASQFKSNQNQHINAAYQIIKKAFPTTRYSLPDHGILGCNTHPVKLTIKSQAS